MSLWQVAILIGVIAGCIVAAAIYKAYLQAQLSRLERYEYWSDKFYTAAKPLVLHPETPPSIIKMIGGMNGLIVDGYSPIGIAKIFGSKERRQAHQQEKHDDPEFDTFFDKNPDLAKNALTVSRAGLLASSYASLVGSVQARAALAETFYDTTLEHDVQEARDVEAVRSVPKSGLVPNLFRK